MEKRAKTATVDLKVRMKEPLRAAIENAAANNGVSMNAEAVNRLQRTFSEDDVFETSLGGPEMRQKVELMISAFGHNGHLMAQALGHPEWSARDWMNDPQCYRSAVRGVLRALIVAQPNHGWEKNEVYLEVDGLKGEIATWLANAGKLKPEFGGD